jgi:tripartite-type tricarboxylate transporter receptor subunit TctC
VINSVSRRFVLSGALGLAAASGARAQGAAPYPNRLIKVIVPYPPAGVTDLVGRAVADGLKERLHVGTIVENKPGANGIVGMGEFLRTDPDGYTILIGGFGSHLIPPLINPRFPFDVERDFAPIALVAEFVNVMIVNKSLPVDTVADFIRYAKERPGQLNFGTVGVGASNHLAAELFMQQTGVRMVNVPYKGAPASLQDLTAGNLHVLFENLPPALGQVQGGTVKALAVTSTYRVQQLPNVPTMAEAGLPDYKITSWIGVYGHRALPAPIRDKLSRTIVDIVKDPAVQSRFRTIGFEPVGADAETFERFSQEERKRWKAVVDAAGIKVEAQ